MENFSWLSEEKLGFYLKELFGVDFIRDRKIPNSNTLFRPDYRNDTLGLIVEFDGPRHYTEAKIVFRDKDKIELYKSLGYRVIRIPDFVQWSTETIKNLFGINFPVNKVYQHGFWYEKALLPCDYCTIGAMRFFHEIENDFLFAKEEIVRSLLLKVDELENPLLVFPTIELYNKYKNT